MCPSLRRKMSTMASRWCVVFKFCRCRNSCHSCLSRLGSACLICDVVVTATENSSLVQLERVGQHQALARLRKTQAGHDRPDAMVETVLHQNGRRLEADAAHRAGALNAKLDGDLAGHGGIRRRPRLVD